MLIDVELHQVVSAVNRTYLELVDAALRAFHQADDTAAPPSEERRHDRHAHLPS